MIARLIAWSARNLLLVLFGSGFAAGSLAASGSCLTVPVVAAAAGLDADAGSRGGSPASSATTWEPTSSRTWAARRRAASASARLAYGPTRTRWMVRPSRPSTRS